jgi:hypothetical protein
VTSVARNFSPPSSHSGSLLTEIRQFHALISLTLNRLSLEIPEESGVLGLAGVNKARSAANKRWRP